MKSLILSYCFLLVIAGLFIFNGSKPTVEKKNGKTYMMEVSINESSKIVLSNNSSTHSNNVKINSSSSIIDRVSIYPTNDFIIQFLPVEKRSQNRAGLGFTTYLKV